jgi:hypothetical protein
MLWGMAVKMEGDPDTWVPDDYAIEPADPSGISNDSDDPNGVTKYDFPGFKYDQGGWNNGWFGAYGWGEDPRAQWSEENEDGWYRQGYIRNQRLNEDGSALVEHERNAGNNNALATPGADFTDIDDIYLCEGESPGQPIGFRDLEPETFYSGHSHQQHDWQDTYQDLEGVATPKGYDKLYGLRPQARYEGVWSSREGPGLSKTDAAIAGGALFDWGEGDGEIEYRAFVQGFNRSEDTNWYSQSGNSQYNGWAWGHPGDLYGEADMK